MPVRIAACLLTATAFAVLSACGGGGKSSNSTSGPTHAQFVASANRICATAERQTVPLIAKVKSGGIGAVLSGDAAKLAPPVTRLHDIAAANLAKLRALTQPAADRAAIERFLRPLATVVADIGAAARDLAKGQGLDAYALIQQARPVAARVSSAARSYGVPQCGAVLAAIA